MQLKRWHQIVISHLEKEALPGWRVTLMPGSHLHTTLGQLCSFNLNSPITTACRQACPSRQRGKQRHSLQRHQEPPTPPHTHTRHQSPREADPGCVLQFPEGLTLLHVARTSPGIPTSGPALWLGRDSSPVLSSIRAGTLSGQAW